VFPLDVSRLKSSPLAISNATFATPTRLATRFRRIALRAMRPSTYSEAFALTPDNRRPFVTIRTDGVSKTICQHSSASRPPATAVIYEHVAHPRCARRLVTTQLRKEDAHARERQTESTNATAQEPAPDGELRKALTGAWEGRRQLKAVGG
jgi:hypothetical protein